MTDSGPAAASKPFFEAIDSNDAVGGGSESLGHGEGSKRSFASPATAWNPMAYNVEISMIHPHMVSKLSYLCLYFLQVRPRLYLYIIRAV